MDYLPRGARTWLHRAKPDGTTEVVESGTLTAMIRYARQLPPDEAGKLKFSIDQVEGMRSWAEVSRAAERYRSI